MGEAWARAAASTRIHEAEIVDERRIELAAGTPALLTTEEARDVLEILDLVVTASAPGPARDQCEELAFVLRQRLQAAHRIHAQDTRSH